MSLLLTTWYTHLLEGRDLPLLKKFGKKIFVTFQGSDVRQVDYCLKNHDITFMREASYDLSLNIYDELKRQRVNLFDRFANNIYALNPDLLGVLPARAKFLPYGHINIDEWNIKQGSNLNKDAKLKILHAPTNRTIKGTVYIEQAINQLINEGYLIEFCLVENKSNADAKQMYQSADLLIDQLLVGWYGGLAVELMAMGKPTIAYLRPRDIERIPPKMQEMLPIVNADPTSIYKTLKYYLQLPVQSQIDLGQQSRKFVETWHNPMLIAKAMIEDYYLL